MNPTEGVSPDALEGTLKSTLKLTLQKRKSTIIAPLNCYDKGKLKSIECYKMSNIDKRFKYEVHKMDFIKRKLE